MKKILVLLVCLGLMACSSTAPKATVENEVKSAIVSMMEKNESTSEWFMGITMPEEKSVSGNEYKVSLIMDEGSVDATYGEIVKTIKSSVLEIAKGSLEEVKVEEAPKNFFVYYRIPYASTEFYILAIYDNGMVSFEKDVTAKKDYTYYQLSDEVIAQLTETINTAYKPILDDMAENPEKYQKSEDESESGM